jgi:putative hemolysin
LSHEELAALLNLSGDAGVIDTEEERILQDVLNLGRLKVRDVMTPRVKMIAAPITASRSDVLAIVKQDRFTKLPIYEDDLDTIVGLLSVTRYLAEPEVGEQSLRGRTKPLQFVPEMATLDQLLDHFQVTKSQLAIVVDEFGGTAGIVAIEDVVEEIVGDISASDDDISQQPQLIGLNQWRAAGDLSVHDWAEAFGQRLVSPRVATLGGLITAHLGRAPSPQDAVEIGGVRLEVERVEHARVETVIVTFLREQESPEAAR